MALTPFGLTLHPLTSSLPYGSYEVLRHSCLLRRSSLGCEGWTPEALTTQTK